MIVVDRNLEERKGGQDFIADIRSSKIYTEIIFYTAMNTSDLWEEIYKNKLEGVYVSNRDDIFSKIIKVGEQSIRKILDLENMRGIVMAEVGELDLMLDEIIIIGSDGLTETQRQEIYKKFHDGANDQHDQRGQQLKEFSQNPDTLTMLKLCDSDKRWQNLNRLWKVHRKLKEKQKPGEYTTDVLRPRNFLAHGKPERVKDGEYIFKYNGQSYHFDEAASTSLRQTIMRYKNEFSKIIESLK